MFAIGWYSFWSLWTAACALYAVRDVARGAVDIGVIAPAFLRRADPFFFWWHIGKRVGGAAMGVSMIWLGIALRL